MGSLSLVFNHLSELSHKWRSYLSHKDKLTFRREAQAVSLGLNPGRKIVGNKPDFMCILG
jgi:hypothetical protein